MILLFLIVLVGGAFAIAVLASDAHFGKTNPKDGYDEKTRKRLP